MPTLALIGSIEVGMHWKEVEEPHFHIYFNGAKYRFSVSTLEQLRTDHAAVPDQLWRKVRKWAKPRIQMLQTAWADCEAKIDPRIQWRESEQALNRKSKDNQ